MMRRARAPGRRRPGCSADLGPTDPPPRPRLLPESLGVIHDRKSIDPDGGRRRPEGPRLRVGGPGEDLGELAEVIDHAAHLLPQQGPITVFIHHNTLHALEDLPFHEARAQGCAGLRLPAVPHRGPLSRRAEARADPLLRAPGGPRGGPGGPGPGAGAGLRHADRAAAGDAPVSAAGSARPTSWCGTSPSRMRCGASGRRSPRRSAAG